MTERKNSLKTTLFIILNAVEGLVLLLSLFIFISVYNPYVPLYSGGLYAAVFLILLFITAFHISIGVIMLAYGTIMSTSRKCTLIPFLAAVWGLISLIALDNLILHQYKFITTAFILFGAALFMLHIAILSFEIRKLPQNSLSVKKAV